MRYIHQYISHSEKELMKGAVTFNEMCCELMECAERVNWV